MKITDNTCYNCKSNNIIYDKQKTCKTLEWCLQIYMLLATKEIITTNI